MISSALESHLSSSFLTRLCLPMARNGSSYVFRDHWPMPDGVPEELAAFLSDTMRRDPSARPTAEQCLDYYNFMKSDIERELSFHKRAVKALKDRLLGQKADKPAPRRHHSVI